MKPKPLAYLIAACVGTGLAVTALVGDAGRPEILWGLLGPLAAVSVTWVVIDLTLARRPDRVMAVMVQAFVIKLVFFATYVVVMVGPVGLRLVPFTASFLSSLVVTYVAEAVRLKRLGDQRAGALG